MENPYQYNEAQVVEIKEETPAIKTFVLKPERRTTFETGQFMELSIPGFGEGPFTPSSNPKDDTKLEFTIMNVGRVTDALHGLRKNSVLGLRGPYGKGYPLKDFQDKEILIVGGGVGFAPLRGLIYALFNEIDKYKKIRLKYGARTPADIVYKDEINDWTKKADITLTVDAGDKDWKGNVGLVTTILDNLNMDLKNSISCVCGPPIMMKFVTFKLLDIGFKPERIYLSMEKNMSCGIGKCGHCRIGNFYACKDGPVFTYDTIKDFPNIWD